MPIICINCGGLGGRGGHVPGTRLAVAENRCDTTEGGRFVLVPTSFPDVTTVVWMNASASLHANEAEGAEVFERALAAAKAAGAEEPPVSIRLVTFALSAIARYCEKRRTCTRVAGDGLSLEPLVWE